MSWYGDVFVDFANPYLVSYPGNPGAEARWMEVRAQAFERQVSVLDPWSVDCIGKDTPAVSFHVSPNELLRRARKTVPEHSAVSESATASAFADWVYSLYRAQRNLEGMARGLELENIWGVELKHEATFGRINSPLWKLFYRGMGEVNDSSQTFYAPSLRIQGQPLRCRPDLVYRHHTDSCVAIVEVKCTSKPIPRTLWPNVWAQLWVYSKIEEFAKTEKLIVQAEIWTEHGARLVLRKVVSRDPRRETFDCFYNELFGIYQRHISLQLERS